MEEELKRYIADVLKVCSARAVFVINYILENGSINSQEIRNEGYIHGARAVGDVRDNGIPLITSNVKSFDNRNIAEYRFGSASDIKPHKFGGRKNFPASLKKDLVNRDGLVCAISDKVLPDSELQIDHRIPYYVSGDIDGVRNPDDFMLLSASMQRTKSWDCENCDNLKLYFDLDICKTCYWAYPENYSHVAMRKQRSINLIWQNDEVVEFDELKKESDNLQKTPQEMIKLIIRKRYNL